MIRCFLVFLLLRVSRQFNYRRTIKIHAPFAAHDATVATLYNETLEVAPWYAFLSDIGEKYTSPGYLSIGVDQIERQTLLWNLTQVTLIDGSANNSIQAIYTANDSKITTSGFYNSTVIYVITEQNFIFIALNHNRFVPFLSIREYTKQKSLVGAINVLLKQEKIHQNLLDGGHTLLTADHSDVLHIRLYSGNYIYFSDNSGENTSIQVLTVPIHQNFTVKYLFSISSAHVFALFSSKYICYQFFQRTTNKSHYGNIVCMATVEAERITTVDYSKRSKRIMLYMESKKHFEIEEFDQCVLYYQIPKYVCYLCKNNCYKSCHELVQKSCNRIPRYRFRGELIMALLIMTLMVTILKQLNQILAAIYNVCYVILKLTFCFIPKQMYGFLRLMNLKLKNQYVRLRNRVTHIPLQNQPCPICLENLSNPVYFACQRHMACDSCMKEFQEKFANKNIACPFRD